MRRLMTTAMLFSLALQPVAVFAIFESPSSLLQALRMDPSSRSFDGEFHMSMKDQTYVSGWFSGVQRGTSIQDGAMDAKMTVDVSDIKEHVKGRIRLSLRAVDQKAYVRMDGVEGSFEDDTMLVSVKMFMKKWIAVPIDPSVLEQADAQADMSFLDQIMNLTSVDSRYGKSYILTLKPGLIEEMADLTAAFEMKVDTNWRDAWQVMKVTGTASAEDMRATLAFNAQRNDRALVVRAPEQVISLEDIFSHVDSMYPAVNNLPALDGLIPVLEPRGGGAADGAASEIQEPESTGCSVGEMRKGLCNTERTSRRTLRSDIQKNRAR